MSWSLSFVDLRDGGPRSFADYLALRDQLLATDPPTPNIAVLADRLATRWPEQISGLRGRGRVLSAHVSYGPPPINVEALLAEAGAVGAVMLDEGNGSVFPPPELYATWDEAAWRVEYPEAYRPRLGWFAVHFYAFHVADEAARFGRFITALRDHLPAVLPGTYRSDEQRPDRFVWEERSLFRSALISGTGRWTHALGDGAVYGIRGPSGRGNRHGYVNVSLNIDGAALSTADNRTKMSMAIGLLATSLEAFYALAQMTTRVSLVDGTLALDGNGPPQNPHPDGPRHYLGREWRGLPDNLNIVCEWFGAPYVPLLGEDLTSRVTPAGEGVGIEYFADLTERAQLLPADLICHGGRDRANVPPMLVD